MLRQILKPTKKNKKTDVAIKYVAAAQYPEERVNLPGYAINHKEKNHDCNYILNGVGNDNYNTFS